MAGILPGAGIRGKLKIAAYSCVQSHDFATLFRKYDIDHSGEINFVEFESAIRGDMAITEAEIDAAELRNVFADVVRLYVTTICLSIGAI